jgi:hypothetical protein
MDIHLDFMPIQTMLTPYLKTTPTKHITTHRITR